MVFGAGNTYTDEKTYSAEGCRYSEFHWRQLRPIQRVTVKQPRVIDMLPVVADTVIRVRFEVDGDQKCRVVLIPNEYTLAKKEKVVWEGFCVFINEAFQPIMEEALL